jgi:hypothetical protein
MATRLRFALALLLLSLLTSCAPAAPLVLSGGPKPPILDPNLLGRPNRNIQLITDLAALEACLDSGALPRMAPRCKPPTCAATPTR